MKKIAVALLLFGASVLMTYPSLGKKSATPTKTPTVAVTTQEPKKVAPPVEVKKKEASTAKDEDVIVINDQTLNSGSTRDKDVAEMEQYMRDYGQARGEYYREKYGW